MWPDTKPRRFIVWGLTLYTHTHSQIHYAFDKAAKSMGWNSTWLPDTQASALQLKDESFDDVLILTAGGHDQHIPIKTNAFYILHNCDHSKYSSVPESHKMWLQVYTNEILSRNLFALPGRKYEQWQADGNVFQMPWATDLLPHEVNSNMDRVRQGEVPAKNQVAVFVGTRGQGQFGNSKELDAFQKGLAPWNCKLTCHTSTSINNESAMNLIQGAAFAPTIVGTWQKEKGYIPCRIFKTISQGHQGLTNSFEAADCVNHCAVYDADESKLLGKQYASQISKENILEAMTLIRDHHTYINRVQSLQVVYQMKQKNK